MQAMNLETLAVVLEKPEHLVLSTLSLTAPSEDDVVVDLGAGLGKVALLARMLTGATVRGVEVQESLVRRAREAAGRGRDR